MSRQCTPCWVSRRAAQDSCQQKIPLPRSQEAACRARAKVTTVGLAAERACEEPLWRWNWWEGREKKGRNTLTSCSLPLTVLPTPPMAERSEQPAYRGLG